MPPDGGPIDQSPSRRPSLIGDLPVSREHCGVSSAGSKQRHYRARFGRHILRHDRSSVSKTLMGTACGLVRPRIPDHADSLSDSSNRNPCPGTAIDVAWKLRRFTYRNTDGAIRALRRVRTGLTADEAREA